MSGKREPRQVNEYLGVKASIGPIPQELFMPWVVLLLIVVSTTQVLLKTSWVWTLVLSVWACGTWTILVGRRPYLFLGKFFPVPYKWSRGYVRYLSFERYFEDYVAKQLMKQNKQNKNRRRKRVG